MRNRIKMIGAILLISSMLVLSFMKYQEGDWEDAAVGVLYSIANVIIFIV